MGIPDVRHLRPLELFTTQLQFDLQIKITSEVHQNYTAHMNADLQGHVPAPPIFLLFGNVTFQILPLQNANTCIKINQNIYFIYLDNKEILSL